MVEDLTPENMERFLKALAESEPETLEAFEAIRDALEPFVEGLKEQEARLRAEAVDDSPKSLAQFALATQIHMLVTQYETMRDMDYDEMSEEELAGLLRLLYQAKS